MADGSTATRTETRPARPRLTLARKLARAFVGLVTLVLAVNGGVSMWLSYGEARRAALGVQQEKALAAAERVAQFVAEIENQLGWTTRTEWSRVAADQRRHDFIRLLRQVPERPHRIHHHPAARQFRSADMNLLILVVDDEPDVEALFRQQFRREIRDRRFAMDFAASAFQALDRVAAADGVFGKPIDFPALKAEIDQCLLSHGLPS